MNVRSFRSRACVAGILMLALLLSAIPLAVAAPGDPENSFVDEFVLSRQQASQQVVPGPAGDAPSVAPTRCFDFNKSGVVDVADIQQVADLWHQDALLPYDCDGDGTITVFDIMCASAQFGQPCYRPYGLNFSPYIAPDENPNLGGNQITDQELMERLSTIAPYSEWIRTFGCNADLRESGAYAHSLGLKAAVGAWIDSDLDENQSQIDCLLAEAQAGNVDMAIVGSETLLRDSLSESQLISYITQVKQSLVAAGLGDIPVAYADVYGVLLNHGAVRAAVDLILANYYPYWEGRSVTYAMAYLHRWHQQLSSAYPIRPVIVSETGWPSCGNPIGDAIPSPENASFYWLNFVSWARANDVPYLYFSTYNELWKAQFEGPQGACWGVWDRFGSLKPGMEPVFDGVTMPDNWTNPPPEAPIVDFFGLPALTQTNLSTFVVAGYTDPGDEIWLNGSQVAGSAVDPAGNFAIALPLTQGSNLVQLEIKSSGTVVASAEKTVLFDPVFSSAGKRLLYVDSVSWGPGVPELPGTIVIDLDGNTLLGLIPDKHVVGISPAGSEIYTSDRQAISSATHQVLRTLPFSEDIPSNGFLVAPDGTRLYSRNQRLDVASNTLLPNLPTDITTGSSWGGEIPGGPAISPDSHTIYCCNTLTVIDTISNSVTTPGISASFLSDIEYAGDLDRILISTYSYGSGSLQVYDAQDFASLGSIGGLGDYVGEITLARDGQRVVVGSRGNPAWSTDGRVSTIDLVSLTQVSYKQVPLADNLATSGNNEFFVSTGENGLLFRRLGIDVYVLDPTGQLVRTKTFFLGINRWVAVQGYDQIRRIVFKP